jgi:hypothetical protein
MAVSFVGAPVVGKNADERLELFMLGADGALYHVWQQAPNSGWSDWYSLGYEGGGFTGIPTVATNPDGRLELFMLGNDGVLYHNWQPSPGAGWSGWYSMGVPQ